MFSRFYTKIQPCQMCKILCTCTTASAKLHLLRNRWKIEHFCILYLNTYWWGFVIAVFLLVYELKLCGLMCPVTRCPSLLCDFPPVFIYTHKHRSSPAKKLARSWGNSKNYAEIHSTMTTKVIFRAHYPFSYFLELYWSALKTFLYGFTFHLFQNL